MTWNWQHPDWPKFHWDATKLTRLESLFLEEAGMAGGAAMHLQASVRDTLIVEMLTTGALDTSEIEGEHLDRDSVQSSIRRHLGLDTDKLKVKPAEAGIAEMMVHVFQTYFQPLTQDTLCDWHGMVAKGRSDLEHVGEYRTHAEPMRIVSGAGGRMKVHFEAPPSRRIPAEMGRFLDWFNQDARGTPCDGGTQSILARAGIAHLWFESIHPFEDGNGRIGRAIAEKALMQGLSHPVIPALSPTLLARRKEYYSALEQASRSLEITPWLSWFASTVLEAERRGLSLVAFLIHKTRLMDSLRGVINPRQEKALLRMFEAGIDGFKGGMSAGKYAGLTGAPPATVTRDLADLVAKGALVRVGEKKATRYHLDIPAMRGEQ